MFSRTVFFMKGCRMRKPQFFCLLPLVFCLDVVACVNITLSSLHGSFTTTISEDDMVDSFGEFSHWIVDQIFWENFNLLFPSVLLWRRNISAIDCKQSFSLHHDNS